MPPKDFLSFLPLINIFWAGNIFTSIISTYSSIKCYKVHHNPQKEKKQYLHKNSNENERFLFIYLNVIVFSCIANLIGINLCFFNGTI